MTVLCVIALQFPMSKLSGRALRSQSLEPARVKSRPSQLLVQTKTKPHYEVER